MTKLYMPDGREVEQGGPEDMATWWTCRGCGFRGPLVGSRPDGSHRCLGSCGGVTENPNAPRADRFASMPSCGASAFQIEAAPLPETVDTRPRRVPRHTGDCTVWCHDDHCYEQSTMTARELGDRVAELEAQLDNAEGDPS